MSDDDYKRAKMKEMGLAPHEIEKAIRQANEDEIYADEVYLYVRDITLHVPVFGFVCLVVVFGLVLFTLFADLICFNLPNK